MNIIRNGGPQRCSWECCHSSFVIAGDVNFHYEDTMNVHTRKLRDQLEIFSLVQAVNLPTHINGHILDLVIVNEPSPVHSTQVNYDLASDHFSILCSLALQKPKQSAKVVSTRSLNKIDHKKLTIRNFLLMFLILLHPPCP